MAVSAAGSGGSRPRAKPQGQSESQLNRKTAAAAAPPATGSAGRPSGAQQARQPESEPGACPAAGLQLRRSLGLASGASVIVGVIVGSGIFVSPRGVLELAGSCGAALLVWSLCGLLSMLGALCFAELGTSVPTSGGDYTYIRLAYGPLASFLYLWVTVLIILPCSNAISALAFANYVLKPLYTIAASALAGAQTATLAPPNESEFGGLANGAAHTIASPVPTTSTSTSASASSSTSGLESGQLLLDECQPPEEAIRLVALAVLYGLVYLNCASVKWSLWLQNGSSLAKVLAMGALVACGLAYLIGGHAQAHLSDWERIFQHTSTSVPDLAQAFYAAFYTYAGWNALNCVTEEMKDPVRNMPRAIIISLTCITIIYILSNVAYFAVLSRDEILQSDAIAVLFGQKALSFAGRHLANWAMPLTVAVSTMGGLNGNIFASSRILYAGAREGQLFESLQSINLDNLTPIPSLLFLALISSFYLFTTKILSLINYMIFIEASFAALSVSTVLVLRRKLPRLDRPLRVPTMVPVAYLLFSLFLILLPVWSSPIQAAIGLLITLTGVPAYYLTVRWQPKPARYQNSIDRFNLMIKKLSRSVSSDVEGHSALD